MEPTSLPWYQDGDFINFEYMDDDGNLHYGTICEMGLRGMVKHANGKFIVRAVNNHTALIAALENAKEIIRIYYGMKCLPGHDEAERWRLYQASPEMERINEALAKARQ